MRHFLKVLLLGTVSFGVVGITLFSGNALSDPPGKGVNATNPYRATTEARSHWQFMADSSDINPTFDVRPETGSVLNGAGVKIGTYEYGQGMRTVNLNNGVSLTMDAQGNNVSYTPAVSYVDSPTISPTVQSGSPKVTTPLNSSQNVVTGQRIVDGETVQYINGEAYNMDGTPFYPKGSATTPTTQGGGYGGPTLGDYTDPGEIAYRYGGDPTGAAAPVQGEPNLELSAHGGEPTWDANVTPGENGTPTSMQAALDSTPQQTPQTYADGSPRSNATVLDESGVDNSVPESKNLGEYEGKEAAASAKEKVQPEKTVSWNYLQHVILILEALEANKIEDATRKVNVKAAEMQDTQGDQCSGASQITTKDINTPMSATTIADAATAMNNLLQQGKIDLSLLSTDITEPESHTAETLSASSGKSGAEVDGDVHTQSGADKDLTTKEEREIKRRRALLLSEWATAGTQIGEGSNAISHAFYDRAKAFATAANSAHGSLGGITTITDTDRFVLFELTRGAALSAIQLGLQGSVNLNDLSEIVVGKSKEDSDKPLSAGAGES